MFGELPGRFRAQYLYLKGFHRGIKVGMRVSRVPSFWVYSYVTAACCPNGSVRSHSTRMSGIKGYTSEYLVYSTSAVRLHSCDLYIGMPQASAEVLPPAFAFSIRRIQEAKQANLAIGV